MVWSIYTVLPLNERYQDMSLSPQVRHVSSLK
jgi:hypothetical protein